MTTFAAPKGGVDPVVAEIIDIIRRADAARPRSRQEAPGPSTLGHTCDRHLAYKSRRTRKVSQVGDPLIAIIGTAAHSWMEEAVQYYNKTLGRERFITERKVKMWLPDDTEVQGTADCYDTDDGRVLDWKFLGADALKTIKRGQPSLGYVRQTHLYGLGYQHEGFEVKEVALIGIPRSGRLSDIVAWRAPYDPDIAMQTLDRYHGISKLPDQLEVDDDESRWGWIPTGDNPPCHFCPYYRPGEPVSSTGCPGA